jgi:small subunit ribosomal protein S36
VTVADGDEAPTGRVRVPRAVWALTVLFGVLLAVSSVAAPLFLAPDEFVHADLALRLADDPHYPEHDGRRTSVAVKRVAIPYFSPDARTPDKEADDAPPKSGRLDIHSLGGSGDDPTGGYNQQPQHPPLYYQLLGLVLRVERFVLPGGSPPALVTEVALLRLVNAAMVVWLPLAAWAVAHRLGARRATAVAAAALTLTIPQLTHIGSTINNDNLLVALAAGLSVLLAGVLRGDRSARTALVVGLVAGAAVLTKATAVLLLPWVAVVYLIAARRGRDDGASPLGTVATGAISAAVVALLTGWWWIGNRRRTGSFAPSLEETLIPSQPGFEPDLWWFSKRFGAFFTERFWGWFGLYSARMPLWVIGAATVALVALVVLALVRRSPDASRADLVVQLLPAALLLAFVVQHAWSIYARSGQTPFIQGRYLFPAVVPLVVVAAVGLRRVAGTRAPLVALAAGLGLHLVGFATMLDHFWGAPGEALGGEVRALVAWSAWPGEALAVGALVAVVLAVVAVAVVVVDRGDERDAAVVEGEHEAAPDPV